MAVTLKTREERREELKRLAAMPNGIDKLYLILTRNFIPFEKLPIGTLMIEAILDHEYRRANSDIERRDGERPSEPANLPTCPGVTAGMSSSQQFEQRQSVPRDQHGEEASSRPPGLLGMAFATVGGVWPVSRRRSDPGE
jgi:hypothetical protein